MKKIVMAGVVFSMLLSCSTDSSETQFQSTGSLNDVRVKSSSLTLLYNNMLSSKTYLDFELQKDQFMDRMNFDGSKADLQDESRILSWISANIGKTDFVNLNEAEESWRSLKTKQVAVVTENSRFFSELYGTEGELYQIMLDPPYEQSPNGCVENCNSINAGCNANADYNCSIAMEMASAYAYFGDYGSAGEWITVGVINYSYDLAACGASHTACLGGC